MNIPQHRRKKIHSGPLTKSQKRRQKDRQSQRRRRKSKGKVSLCEIQFPGVLRAPDGSTIKTRRRIPQKFRKPRDI